VRLSVRSRLGLICNQDIDIGKNLVELILEELRDKRRRQIENENLILCSCLLGERQDSFHRDGQMVAADVEELCILDLLPDLRLLQVVHLVLVRGGKVGAQRAVVACDDDTAAAGRSLFVVAVFGLNASFGADIFELLAILVAADAADVYGRVGR
jgi:hypothetical protein